MKKILGSYLSFTRSERRGLLVISAILVLLIVVRATMSLWVDQEIDTASENNLIMEWQAFKGRAAHTERTKEATTLPEFADLNTADSLTLVAMNGIGPKTAHNIIIRREKKGPFTDYEQLRETGSFTDSTFEYLKKHLKINADNK